MTDTITNYLNLIEPIYGIPYYECIIKHKGEVIYKYKSERLKACGKDMYFGYSVTKPITCAGVLRLVEQGKIKLDNYLYKYLPEFEHMCILNDGRRVEAQNKITIEDLFSMCAGFNYNMYSPSIQNVIKANPNATTREIIRELAKEPLEFEPSSRYQYSLCHDVLVAVAEEVTGMSFGEYQRENIFKPLDMSDTSYKMTDEMYKRMVPKLYYTYGTGLAKTDMTNMYILTPNYESGGAGILTTAENYIEFASVMANGGRSKDGYQLLKAETIADMKKNRLTKDKVGEGYKRKAMQGYGYGLGVRTMINPALLCSNAPAGEFGWSGAAGAYTLMDTENNLAVYYAQHVYSMVRVAEEVHPMIRELAYTLIKKGDKSHEI